MVIFNAKVDIPNRRKVLLKGRVVTVIGLAGSRARIAEDGKWYESKMFFELTDKDIVQMRLEKIAALITGKTIATLKSDGTGIQLVLEDNTRLGVTYSKDGEGISFSVIDSGGTKVL
jgi:hypothetical protein